MEDIIKELEKRREQAKLGGGQDRIQKESLLQERELIFC